MPLLRDVHSREPIKSYSLMGLQMLCTFHDLRAQRDPANAETFLPTREMTVIYYPDGNDLEHMDDRSTFDDLSVAKVQSSWLSTRAPECRCQRRCNSCLKDRVACQVRCHRPVLSERAHAWGGCHVCW